jgi:hypothetical protein
MASGHVNRANRPNTWLLRPMLQREDSPCQPGAVHMALRVISRRRSNSVAFGAKRTSANGLQNLVISTRPSASLHSRIRYDD